MNIVIKVCLLSIYVYHYYFHHRQFIPMPDWYKIAIPFIACKRFSGKSIDKKYLDALMTGWR